MPDKLLSEGYGTKWREEVLSNHNIRTIVDLREMNVFEDATNSPIIFVVETNSDKQNISILEYQGDELATKYQAKQTDFAELRESRIRLDWDENTREILQSIMENTFEASRILYASIGIAAGDTKKYFSYGEKPDDPDAEPLIKGRNVRRYRIDYENDWVLYRPDELHRPSFPELFEQDKLVFREVAGKDGLIGCLDTEGYYTDHSLYNCVLKTQFTNIDEEVLKARGISITDSYREEKSGDEKTFDRDSIIYKDDLELASEYSLAYILAIFSSTTVGYYYEKAVSGDLNVFPQQIRNIPLPNLNIVSCDNSESEYVFEDHAKVMSGDIGEDDLLRSIATAKNEDSTKLIVELLSKLSITIIELRKKRDSLELSLLDYLGSYETEVSVADMGLYLPKADSDSILHQTKADKENLRIGDAMVERLSTDTVLIKATARYKPEDSENYTTDQWGYTETDYLPAFRITDLDKTEADMIEHFIPVAVSKAGGFANFREGATKTNSLIDRLNGVRTPNVSQQSESLQRYIETKSRADDLEEQIRSLDQLIDKIVYQLYELPTEFIRDIEESQYD